MTDSVTLNALAIDTSSDWLSLALMAEGEPVGSLYSHQRTRVNQSLFAEIDALLTGAGLRVPDLHLIVAARGPGSFTGTRLGLGVAQTFAAVAEVPLLGVDTLALLAAQTDPATEGTVHAVLNCAREEVHHAPFQWADGELEPRGELRLLDVETLADELREAPVVLRRFPQRGRPRPALEAQFARLRLLPLARPQPDGLLLLQLGLAAWRRYQAQREAAPLPPAAPIYLKSEAFRTWQRPGAAAEGRP